MAEKAEKVIEALNFILDVDLHPDVVFKDISKELYYEDGAWVPRGYFRRPCFIVIDTRKGWKIRTLVHEFCHMWSYNRRNKSMMRYDHNKSWHERAEEQLATKMTKALVPLVKKYLRNDKKDIKRRWRQLKTSLKGTFTRLEENQATNTSLF